MTRPMALCTGLSVWLLTLMVASGVAPTTVSAQISLVSVEQEIEIGKAANAQVRKDMPELRDAAPREILALSPGYSDMDFTRLPYRYVTRPIFPLDGDFAWQPVITNVAGYAD